MTMTNEKFWTDALSNSRQYGRLKAHLDGIVASSDYEAQTTALFQTGLDRYNAAKTDTQRSDVMKAINTQRTTLRRSFKDAAKAEGSIQYIVPKIGTPLVSRKGTIRELTVEFDVENFPSNRTDLERALDALAALNKAFSKLEDPQDRLAVQQATEVAIFPVSKAA